MTRSNTLPAGFSDLEPLVVKEIPPETARSINAAIPFSSAPNPAARPFQFTGTPDDRERAVACLAAAGRIDTGHLIELHPDAAFVIAVST